MRAKIFLLKSDGVHFVRHQGGERYSEKVYQATSMIWGVLLIFPNGRYQFDRQNSECDEFVFPLYKALGLQINESICILSFFKVI